MVVLAVRRAAQDNTSSTTSLPYAKGFPTSGDGSPSTPGSLVPRSQGIPSSPLASDAEGFKARGDRRELSDLLRSLGAAVFNDTRADEGRLRRLVELINALGKDALYDVLKQSNEPQERWAALSALCSWISVGDRPLQSLGSYVWIETHDERFMRTVEEFALSSASEPRLRSLAIQAVTTFPSERAAPVIVALLGQSGAEADVFLMLDYYTRPLPESVRSQAVRRATEVLGNSSSDDKARGWAVGLLRNNPEAILALFAAIPQESSVMVRRGVASEAARLLTEKHDVPDAATFAERVFGLALTSDDAGVQINIISSLDAAKVRDRYGAAALKVLTTLANRDGNEDVRIAAIRILGQGGYSGAIESLRELAKSPSPAIAREAQSAIKKIGP